MSKSSMGNMAERSKMPDVWFTVSGSTGWDNDAVVARVLKKLAGKYGSSRLGMVVGDEVGLDKIALTQAKHIGIHCVVVPSLHSAYYREAPKLAGLLKLAVLSAMHQHTVDKEVMAGTGNEDTVREPFIIGFFWDLRENHSTRNAIVLAKRAGVRVVSVKVSKLMGMTAAEAWYQMKREKEKTKRKRSKR